MSSNKRSIVILIADDDKDDCQITQRALAKNHLANALHFVHDGEELLNYLQHTGNYTDPDSAPLPGLILLDLNMPKKDGREALNEIKSDPRLRQIPIVILTTSEQEADVYRSYQLGANAFITKPVTFGALVEAMHTVGKFWFDIVTLPQ